MVKTTPQVLSRVGNILNRVRTQDLHNLEVEHPSNYPTKAVSILRKNFLESRFMCKDQSMAYFMRTTLHWWNDISQPFFLHKSNLLTVKRWLMDPISIEVLFCLPFLFVPGKVSFNIRLYRKIEHDTLREWDGRGWLTNKSHDRCFFDQRLIRNKNRNVTGCIDS